MSRIGKQPIKIPTGVTVEMDHSFIVVKGSKGTLERSIHPTIKAEIKDNAIIVVPAIESKRSSALWGLTRTLIANMIAGVSNGFEKQLEFEGIGYRVSQEGNSLVMQLGFSHPVRFAAPAGITLGVQKNIISISGIDKEHVGTIAARIRSLKPPEPYKGKGIRYRGEVIRRKAGKKSASGG